MARHDPNLHVTHTLTRNQPDGWTGRWGRIDKTMLLEDPIPLADKQNIFICGPTPFVEHVSNLLLELGEDALAIKTERFGPTGA